MVRDCVGEGNSSLKVRPVTRLQSQKINKKDSKLINILHPTRQPHTATNQLTQQILPQTPTIIRNQSTQQIDPQNTNMDFNNDPPVKNVFDSNKREKLYKKGK